MYPEEKLGGLINPPSSRWDNVDKLFEGFRDIMSSGNKVEVGTSKNRLFQHQKSKQLNVTLLKEKLPLEILVKGKDLRDAKDLVIKDSGSYIKAENVPIHEKFPLKLNENAPETAIEHGASLTPVHVGGVLQAQIHDDKIL